MGRNGFEIRIGLVPIETRLDEDVQKKVPVLDTLLRRNRAVEQLTQGVERLRHMACLKTAGRSDNLIDEHPLNTTRRQYLVPLSSLFPGDGLPAGLASIADDGVEEL